MVSKIVKVLFVFGTRPEAIKMAPVIREFEKHEDIFEIRVCVTAQHREMLDQVLELFSIKPHYDLDIMTANQTLQDLTKTIISRLTDVLTKERPDMVFVQGDTTTTFVGALTAYYLQIPVAHVEAGLRTQNKFSPFPEEINRRLTGVLADIHFPPTEKAKENLLQEGVDENTVVVTGNTVIDALMTVVRGQEEGGTCQGAGNRKDTMEKCFREKLNLILRNDSGNSKLILVTGHRRESFGKGFKRICAALRLLAGGNPDVQIVYPVHLNPNVRDPVYSMLGNAENIHLIPPLGYVPLVFLLNKSFMVLTDSGGIQEEAPALGKPVLVLRDNSERLEGIEAGTAKLVGTDTGKILEEAQLLLDDDNAYSSMANRVNPYGDGLASKRIFEVIKNYDFRER